MKLATRLVAVVGTGSIGSRHLQVLKGITGVESIAIPKRAERASSLKSEGYRVSNDLRQAASEGAKLCVIATDTARHAEDALLALEYGMDLLIEKPLAVDSAAAGRIASAAAHLSRQVYVAYNLRFSESLNVFREHLKRIGRIYSVNIVCQSYLPDWRPSQDYRQSYSARAAEGGVLRDLIHEIDYAGWIFGWPTKVQGILKNTGMLGILAEESADLLWETPQNAIVSTRLDYLSRKTKRSIVATGEKGELAWDAVLQTVNVHLVGQPPEILSSRQSRDEMMGNQMQAFLNGPNDRLASVKEGVRGLMVCDAVRQASQTGQVMEIQYADE